MARRISYPVLLSRQQQLYLRASFDALDSETMEQGARASGDSLRVLRLSADYALSDTALGPKLAGSNTVSVRFSQGLPWLGASAVDRSDAGRLDERIGFSKVDAEITRDQTLYTFAEGPRLSLYGLAAGQKTADVLPSAESSISAACAARGFYSGEVEGDNGLALTAELRLTSSFSAELLGNPVHVTPQFFAFYDWGATWQIRRVTPTRRCAASGSVSARASPRL